MPLSGELHISSRVVLREALRDFFTKTSGAVGQRHYERPAWLTGRMGVPSRAVATSRCHRPATAGASRFGTMTVRATAADFGHVPEVGMLRPANGGGLGFTKPWAGFGGLL
jgi:hypothetical protein